MNTVTAIRTFAAPGFTPTRHVRIFADRWYLVTMQNVEHGQGDYVGLGEGEYTELLSGKDAKDRRDAHLNHCNAITEYSGPVFELLANLYGGELRHVAYFTSVTQLEASLDQRKRLHEEWLMACRAEASQLDMLADAVEAGEKTSIMSVEQLRNSERECMAVVEKHKDSFRCDAKRIR